jgi:predicted Zn-dependent protease
VTHSGLISRQDLACALASSPAVAREYQPAPDFLATGLGGVMSSRTLLFLGIVATALPSQACRTAAGVKAETALAQALISDDDEKQLGVQVHSELAKQGVKYVTDPVVTNYVAGVAGPIFKEAARQRPNMDWHLHVVDDPKQVNAFATPGGHIYIYSALLKQLHTENELAGVLGHEAGHVIARHSARALVQQFGLQQVAAMALGKNPAALQALGAQIVSTGALLYHSRGAELEADQIGAQVSTAAGWDPRGLVSFLHTLLQEQGGKTSTALT